MSREEPVRAPFDVVRALHPAPVVVEIPHAATAIDERAAAFTRIPERALQAGALEEDADLGADLIWQGTERAGVTRVVARGSRYVIDLNTDPRPSPSPPFYETDPEPRKTLHRSHCGVSWSQHGLPKPERERRIVEIFEPYHRAIATELERVRALHGVACLVSAHTFQDRRRAIADVVLGTLREKAAPAAVRDAAADVARAHGLTVALERPFPGGFSLARHARPDANVLAIQIEIARRLVVGDGEGRRSAPEAGAVARLSEIAFAMVRALVAALADLPPRA